jgi:hypothetical protein
VFIPTPSRFSEYTRWDQAVEFGKLRGLYVSSSDRMAELQVIFQHVALLETFTVQQAGYLPKRFFLYRVGYRPY